MFTGGWVKLKESTKSTTTLIFNSIEKEGFLHTDFIATYQAFNTIFLYRKPYNNLCLEKVQLLNS